MRILTAPFFALVLLSCNNSKKEEKIVSQHSAAFNTSVESVMDNYHALTEAFVNWDSAAVVSKSKDLQSKLAGVKLDEFKPEVKDAASGTLGQAKNDLGTMASANALTEKRRGLNSLTQNLYDFLRAVQYDEKKIYLHECPMAFNDTEAGDWLSESEDIRNPYLGLHHPRYGKAMVDCGETKSTIDYTSSKPKP